MTNRGMIAKLKLKNYKRKCTCSFTPTVFKECLPWVGAQRCTFNRKVKARGGVLASLKSSCIELKCLPDKGRYSKIGPIYKDSCKCTLGNSTLLIKYIFIYKFFFMSFNKSFFSFISFLFI